MTQTRVGKKKRISSARWSIKERHCLSVCLRRASQCALILRRRLPRRWGTSSRASRLFLHSSPFPPPVHHVPGRTAVVVVVSPPVQVQPVDCLCKLAWVPSSNSIRLVWTATGAYHSHPRYSPYARSTNQPCTCTVHYRRPGS